MIVAASSKADVHRAAHIIVVIFAVNAGRLRALTIFSLKVAQVVVPADILLVAGVRPCHIACFLAGIMQSTVPMMYPIITRAMVVFG